MKITPWPRRLVAMAVSFAACCITAGRLPVTAQDAKKDGKKFEIHEWSFWVLDPNHENANARDKYAAALPSAANPLRNQQTPKGQERVTPITLMTFRGEPVEGVEVTIQQAGGSFVGHWPSGDTKNKRLRWPESNLSVERDEKGSLANTTDEHWFQQARKLDTLWLAQGARSERFLSYDAEFKLAVPIKLDADSDKFTLANLTSTAISDVFIAVPTKEGRRIGWANLLPPVPATATTATKGAPESKASEKKDTAAPAAESKKAAAPAKKAVAAPAKEAAKADDKTAEKAEAKPQAKPLTAEAETKLKSPVTLQLVDAPLADVTKFLHDLTKLDFKLDDDALRAANVATTAPVTLSLDQVPLRTAIEAIAGQLKLGFEVDDKGNVTFTKPGVAPAVSATTPPAPPPTGPPVEIALSAPLKEDAAEFTAQTRDELAKRLVAAGLAKDEVELMLSLYAKAVFESKGLVVLCRLPVSFIDEKYPLDVYPEPKKIVRVALLMLRNVDPRTKDEIKELIAQMGSPKYPEREAAERRLIELGAVAVPALKEALSEKDLEIVFRAERILQGRGESTEVKK